MRTIRVRGDARERSYRISGPMERPVQSLHVRPVGLRQARRSGHESEVHALLRPLRKSSEQGPNRRLIDCRRLSARRVIGYSPAFALSLCFASGDLRTLIDLHPRVEHMLLVESHSQSSERDRLGFGKAMPAPLARAQTAGRSRRSQTVLPPPERQSKPNSVPSAPPPLLTPVRVRPRLARVTGRREGSFRVVHARDDHGAGTGWRRIPP